MFLVVFFFFWSERAIFSSLLFWYVCQFKRKIGCELLVFCETTIFSYCPFFARLKRKKSEDCNNFHSFDIFLIISQFDEHLFVQNRRNAWIIFTWMWCVCEYVMWAHNQNKITISTVSRIDTHETFWSVAIDTYKYIFSLAVGFCAICFFYMRPNRKVKPFNWAQWYTIQDIYARTDAAWWAGATETTSE